MQLKSVFWKSSLESKVLMHKNGEDFDPSTVALEVFGRIFIPDNRSKLL